MKSFPLLGKDDPTERTSAELRGTNQDGTQLGRTPPLGSVHGGALEMNVPQRPERMADLLDAELQMSGEVYLASKNLLIDAKGVVIEKRKETC